MLKDTMSMRYVVKEILFSVSLFCVMSCEIYSMDADLPHDEDSQHSYVTMAPISTNIVGDNAWFDDAIYSAAKARSGLDTSRQIVTYMDAHPYNPTDGKSVLHKLVQDNNYKQMYELFILARCHNVPLDSSKLQDHKGKTPLHYAIRWDGFDIPALLLVNGADPNLQDNDGNTPLHAAVLARLGGIAGDMPYGQISSIGRCVRKLITDYKADPNIKNNAGNTLLHLIALNGGVCENNTGDPATWSLYRYAYDENLMDWLLTLPCINSNLRNGNNETAEYILDRAKAYARNPYRDSCCCGCLFMLWQGCMGPDID